jgi:hypothetical protein
MKDKTDTEKGSNRGRMWENLQEMRNENGERGRNKNGEMKIRQECNGRIVPCFCFI